MHKLLIELNQYKLNNAINNKNKLRIGSLFLIYFYVVAKGQLCRRVFSGLCITKKNNAKTSSVTIKKSIKQVGLQMNFLIHSPIIIGYKLMLQNRINRRRSLKRFKNI